MDAAKLVKVPDSISRGVNALPSAGGNSGWVATIPVPATPAPKADPTPRKLDSGMAAPVFSVSNDTRSDFASGSKATASAPQSKAPMLQESQAVTNGQGRMYDGAADNDEDDRPLV